MFHIKRIRSSTQKYLRLLKHENSNKVLRLFGSGKKKVLIFKDKLHWIGLKYDKLVELSIDYRCCFVEFADAPECQPHQLKIEQENYKALLYKGINLYDVSIYSICVELATYIHDVSLSNPNHQSKIKEWFEKSACYIDYIISLFDKHIFSNVVIFQGYFHDSAIVRAIANLRGVPVTALEVTLNSNKLIWDNITGITVNKNLAKNFFWKFENIITSSIARNYVIRLTSEIKSVKRVDHSSPDKSFIKKTSKPLIVLIGQVYTDASLLFGLNRGFNNPIAVIKATVEYAVARNVELVVKLHPKENSCKGDPITRQLYNKLTWRKICEDKPLINQIENSDFITIDCENEYDTYSIIKNADVVITINSQAGLEALIHGKNTILCGASFYGGLGFTYDAQNAQMLKYFIDISLQTKQFYADRELVEKFFYIFFEKYCISKDETKLLDLIFNR